MKKINLKKQLVIFGKPVVDDQGPIMINESLANLLIQMGSGNAVKMMSICIRLHDSGELELDDTDFEFLKSNVKKLEQKEIGADMLIASVLEVLNNAGDEK